MTTTVIVKANHGWPVDVTPKDPKTGAPVQGSPTVPVPPNEERAMYVHSGMDLHIHEVQPDEIAAALAEQLPAPLALEALWPQLARYAVSIAGAFLASRGWVEAADWQVIAGAVLTLAPPAWRTITTLLARRAA